MSIARSERQTVDMINHKGPGSMRGNAETVSIRSCMSELEKQASHVGLARQNHASVWAACTGRVPGLLRKPLLEILVLI